MSWYSIEVQTQDDDRQAVAAWLVGQTGQMLDTTVSVGSGAFCVTSRRPSGRKAMPQGSARPVVKGVAVAAPDAGGGGGAGVGAGDGDGAGPGGSAGPGPGAAASPPPQARMAAVAEPLAASAVSRHSWFRASRRAVEVTVLGSIHSGGCMVRPCWSSQRWRGSAQYGQAPPG